MPKPHHPTVGSGIQTRRENENKCLLAIRNYGHLRRQEIAVAVWPDSTPTTAYQMACRTVTGLLENRVLAERTNSIGGKSLILTSKGAARLRAWRDIPSDPGFSLAVSGPQFYHKTLGSRYLLEKQRDGTQVFSEYAIRKGWSILDVNYLSSKFRKIPDGIVVRDPSEFGMISGGSCLVDWIEVESAEKDYDRIERAFMLLKGNTLLNESGTAELHRLIFVYNKEIDHERKIKKHLRTFFGKTRVDDLESFLESIVFVKCDISIPFQFNGYEEVVCTTDFLKNI